MKLTEIIAPSFYELHRDIKAGKHTEYWLKGGRGSAFWEVDSDTKFTELSDLVKIN